MSQAVYRPRAPDRLALTLEELEALGLRCARGPAPVYALPVLHGRFEFAWLTRQVVTLLRPGAIAVELPESYERAVLRAIERLPLLSVVQSTAGGAGRPVYLPIEPADALIEAVRLGQERAVPVAFADLELERYPQVRERFPDPAAAERLGARAYLETALALVDGHARVDDDDAREATMVYHLQRLLHDEDSRLAGRPILLVCGLHHARAVLKTLDEQLRAGLGAAPIPIRRGVRRSAIVHHLSESSSREILSELPFINAAYERARGRPRARAPQPGRRAPLATIVDLFSRRREPEPEPAPADPYRAAPDDELDVDAPRGRIGLLVELCKQARARYHTSTGNDLRPNTIHGLLRYACRYALTENALTPDLYQLAVAARGFADDNYAHDVWDVATTYPFQTQRPDVAPIELGLRDLHDHIRTIRFRPLTMQRRRRLMKVVRPRPRERRKGEWAERFRGGGLCSYPPEDLALEHYGAYLRRRTVRVLSSEQTRSVPFTSSLLDGIDLRETIRNWHEQTIYVRMQQVIRGRPGDIVVIFEDEARAGHESAPSEPKYPWRMTWQGEHDEEGDMALFATNPFAQVVGPGIGRALYGGFVLHRPPGTMFAVWEDSFYQHARSKAEVLLLAALDHTTERFVVYVAPDPPRQGLRQLARRLGKKIIYTPLGQLSPVALRRIRIFHVLSDHDVRAVARDYIEPT